MVLKIIIIVAVIALVSVALLYNKGINLRNYVKEAFATMDVYLKKRWDLIPNLVETVKGYKEYEKNVLENIIEIRSKGYSDLSNKEKMEINKRLSLGLANLIAVAENYPELKANENFKKLMDELSAIEEDIANSRKYYNGCVREYNTLIEVFPANIIMPIFGFKQEQFFEIDNDQRNNVRVSL